jgi:hypothetical protein
VGFLLLADYNNILITIVSINQMVYDVLSVNLDELKAIADALGVKFEQVFILLDGNEIKTGNE